MVGCNGSSDDDVPPPPSGPAFAGKSVTVAVPTGLPVDFAETWDLPLREWDSGTGAESRVVAFDPKKPADVRVVRLTELAETGPLTAVPSGRRERDGLDWSDVFPGLRDRLANVGGQPCVVPVSCPVLVCYYRADLLEQAGRQPPATWSAYHELAASRADWAPGLSVVEPWGERWRATTFLARAAASAKPPDQLAFAFDIRSGEPLVDTPGFVAALQQARQTLAEMPPDVQTYSPSDCRRELLAGRAALGIALETGTDDVPRAEGVRLGVMRLPGSAATYNQSTRRFDSFPAEKPHRVTLTAFDGLGVVVSADASDPAAAWDLVVHLTMPDPAANFPPPLSSPVRQSQVLDASRWAGGSLTGAESAAWMDAVAASLSDDQQVPELPVAGRRRFRDALTEGLTTALKSESDSQAVLKSVAAKWREIAQDIGGERVRASYRRSLGIAP